MIKTTFELNNQRRDADYISGKIDKNNIIVEVFTALVNGESLEKFGKRGDKIVEGIKNLGNRAENGDFAAIAELNNLRRFVIEAPVMEEIKLLNIFGTYRNVGFDETIEREVYKHVGERSRVQAANGDVVFPSIVKERYPVPTQTVSGGYEVDYRRVALGDMTKENEGLALVRTDIRNRALLLVLTKIYKAIINATGVTYTSEYAGLTQTGFDDVLNKIRRNGRPTFVGDYALISQINGWAGYAGTINSNTILGISEKAMNEIAQTGAISAYKGAIIAEMPNPYNEYELTDDGQDYKTLLPAGLGFIFPAGAKSPVATYTRGGLTSFTGNDVKTGRILTRFDLEVGCDLAKGQENRIGLIHDTNLDGLAN